MTKKALVSPSILAGDFANMGQSVKDVAAYGGDMVHCDVMDGIYVKNITFGMPMISALKKVSDLPLDVHLMITEPERYAAEFIDAGADILTFHPDASKEPSELLRYIKSRGIKAGIVLNPNVPFDDYKHLLFDADVLVVMSVYAGKGGQKFIEESLKTVREAKKFAVENNLSFKIEIDGGVNESNSGAIRDAGADILVAGSAVFKSSNPIKTVNTIKG